MPRPAFKITSKHLEAARLYADGLSQAEVAKTLGITVGKAKDWYEQPLLKAEIDAFIESDRAAIRGKGITVKQNRLDAYNERWKLLNAIIKARSEWDVVAGVPGGNTGLIVRDFKGTANIEIFKIDVGLLKELRELEKQAAIEVGDWTEKKELTGADGGAIPVSIETAIAKAYGDAEQQTTQAD